MDRQQPIKPDFPSPKAEKDSRAAENSKRENWDWDNQSRDVWRLAGKDWQAFNDQWYGNLDSRLDESSVLDVSGMGGKIVSIIVLQSYVTMFDHIWARAFGYETPETGLIITGQPGIGKTLYQYYLLARLLQLRQVVLFSVNTHDHFLFYHNTVYVAPHNVMGETMLPQPKKGVMWSLIDIKSKEDPKPFMINPPCFPVQTTSPDPLRYKMFLKDNEPMFTGLPLWTREELERGLGHQTRYKRLRVALRNFFSPDQGLDDPLAEFSGLHALLKERQERQAEDAKLEDEVDEEECSEDHEQKMMETDVQEVEEALDYLLDKAIERFGYAARAVFKAIFDFDSATKNSRRALDYLSFQRLKDTVISLAGNHTVNFEYSNRIVAICPIYSSNPYEEVDWKVVFNSDWVATEVMKKLKDVEKIELHSLIQRFQGIWQAGSMVGSLFEPLVHALIPKGNFGPLIRMVSDESNESSPKFIIPLETSLNNEVKLEQVTRETTIFKYVTDLSELDDKMYYLPDATNFALFDSFMVDIDYPSRSATLWIFQITKSQLHRGSAKGYPRVRKLTSILKKQLMKDLPSNTAKATLTKKRQKTAKVATPVVKVHYVLVLKVKDEPRNWEWQFPAGWDQGYRYNDYRGDVHCLEISLA